MPTIDNIRFQKFDEYSAIFIANSKTEPKTYKKLKKYHFQLNESYPNNFLPIYHSPQHEYSTIRFKLVKNLKQLNPNDVVSLKFKVKRTASTKNTVYCQLTEFNLISEAVQDYELNLNSDSDSDSN
jgi:hypothetical protein